MRQRLVLVALALVCLNASAQEAGTPAARMNAITSVIEQQRAEQRAIEQAQLAEQQRQAIEAEAELKAQQVKAEAAAARREKAEVAERGQKNVALAEAQRKKGLRDDAVWELELERRKAQVDMEKAKAAHANEYVARDLKRQDAETDVIKSGADATRNVSEGIKSNLQDAGKAQVKKASSIFN